MSPEALCSQILLHATHVIGNPQFRHVAECSVMA